MTATTYAAEAEELARKFAEAYPTPNVLRAVALCESGRLAWVDVAALFAKSYGVSIRTANLALDLAAGK